MDFVRSYFGTNETLTSWTLLPSLFFQISTDQHWSGRKVRTKVFKWSEFHLCRSNFLRNPHFRYIVPSWQIRSLHNIWLNWVWNVLLWCMRIYSHIIFQERCHQTDAIAPNKKRRYSAKQSQPYHVARSIAACRPWNNNIESVEFDAICFSEIWWCLRIVWNPFLMVLKYIWLHTKGVLTWNSSVFVLWS